MVEKATLILFVIISSSLTLEANNLIDGLHRLICISRGSKGCKCTADVTYGQTARCTIDHVLAIPEYIDQPQQVRKLDLSWNNIEEVPPKGFCNFTHLMSLSLASNRIHTIGLEAFDCLTELKALNLNDNNLQRWETTNIHMDLPNLEVLHLQLNFNFLPDEQIFSLPNLTSVNFLLSNINNQETSFLACHFFRQKISDLLQDANRTSRPSRSRVVASDHCSFYKLMDLPETFLNITFHTNFEIKCVTIRNTNFEAKNKQSNTKGWYAITTGSYCWDTINKVYLLSTVIGIFALVFNFVIILTTLRSKMLQESVAHVLVANVASGDFLIALYLTIITITRQSTTSEEFVNFYLPYYCRIVGVFIMMGMCISPVMTFLMTLERYLAIVYCMRPHIRITLKHCYVAIPLAWGLAISIATSFMTFKRFSIETDQVCTPKAGINWKNNLIYPGVVVGSLYLLSVCLYIHIYIDVKRTSNRTEQYQKDSRLSRKVFLVTITNVFFCIIPLLSTFIVTYSALSKYISNENQEIFRSTCTMMSFGVNACINPALFSFRNERFCSELRKQFPWKKLNTVVAVSNN